MQTTSLRNQFLVAMPSLKDEHFDHAVTLMCEHDEQGALGLIINRPTGLTVSAMLDHLEIDHDGLAEDSQVYWGGPVQPERGFVIHTDVGEWESTTRIDEGLYLTSSRDVLGGIGKGEDPGRFIVMLGYAGWTAGQLETELMGNAWLNTPVDEAILFTTPAGERWQAATRLLGLDAASISGDAGHA